MALRVWGMVRAAPAITAASFASVLALPGVRSAMRRTGQPGQVAHGDAHVPGHRHGQGPDGGGLVHHHQKVTVGGRLLVQGAQTRLVAWQGLVEDLLAALGQGRGPVVSLADARCRRRPRCPRYPSFCRLPLKWVRTSRWTIGPAPTPAEDLTRSGSFPLSAVTGARPPPVTLAPRIIYVQGQDTRARSGWPSPGPPGTTNKVTGARAVASRRWKSVPVSPASGASSSWRPARSRLPRCPARRLAWGRRRPWPGSPQPLRPWSSPGWAARTGGAGSTTTLLPDSHSRACPRNVNRIRQVVGQAIANIKS